MHIALIWAEARNQAGQAVLGKDGKMPWHLPEDFKHFVAKTTGHPIIMGRTTWLSLQKRPLPNRTNIVLTRDPSFTADGAVVVSNIDDALAKASAAPGGDTAMVIGGASIFEQTLAKADRLEVTEIDLNVEGDTFAVEIPVNTFHKKQGDWMTSSNGTRYRFDTYLRNKSTENT
jgi:dihydrofolate reductase